MEFEKASIQIGRVAAATGGISRRKLENAIKAALLRDLHGSSPGAAEVAAILRRALSSNSDFRGRGKHAT